MTSLKKMKKALETTRSDSLKMASEKCEFKGCDKQASYKLKWISYNQHNKPVEEIEIYSCKDLLHLIDLSYHPTNNTIEIPDFLVNLENSKKETYFLEQIISKRQELERYKK